MARKYSLGDIIGFGTASDYKYLSKYQRELAQEFRKPVSTSELSDATGAPESAIQYRMENYHGEGLKPGSIHYAHGQGYVAETLSGEFVLFYGIKSANQNEIEWFFGDADNVYRITHELPPKPGQKDSPRLRAGDKMIIPTKTGEYTTKGKKRFTLGDVQRMKGRGMQQSALTHEQRQFAYYMRQHPSGTLSGFRARSKK